MEARRFSIVLMTSAWNSKTINCLILVRPLAGCAFHGHQLGERGVPVDGGLQTSIAPWGLLLLRTRSRTCSTRASASVEGMPCYRGFGRSNGVVDAPDGEDADGDVDEGAEVLDHSRDVETAAAGVAAGFEVGGCWGWALACGALGVENGTDWESGSEDEGEDEARNRAAARAGDWFASMRPIVPGMRLGGKRVGNRRDAAPCEAVPGMPQLRQSHRTPIDFLNCLQGRFRCRATC